MIKHLYIVLPLFLACSKNEQTNEAIPEPDHEKASSTKPNEDPSIEVSSDTKATLPQEVEPSGYDVYDDNGTLLGEVTTKPTSDSPDFDLKSVDGFTLKANLATDVFIPPKGDLDGAIGVLGFSTSCGDFNSTYARKYFPSPVSVFFKDGDGWMLIHTPSNQMEAVTSITDIANHVGSIDGELVCSNTPSGSTNGYKVARVIPSHPYPFKLPFKFAPKE